MASEKKRNSMDEAGALLLGGMDEPESPAKEEADDPVSLAREAMGTMMDAVKSGDVDEALDAFAMLYRLAPELPDTMPRDEPESPAEDAPADEG